MQTHPHFLNAVEYKNTKGNGENKTKPKNVYLKKKQTNPKQNCIINTSKKYKKNLSNWF